MKVNVKHLRNHLTSITNEQTNKHTNPQTNRKRCLLIPLHFAAGAKNITRNHLTSITVLQVLQIYILYFYGKYEIGTQAFAE